MNLDFLTVPAIIVLCFGIGEVVKVTPIDTKYIPVICLISGTILGAVAYLTNIPFMVSVCSDIMTACAIGLASGLAATGVHQVYKQLSTPFDEKHKEGRKGDEV